MEGRGFALVVMTFDDESEARGVASALRNVERADRLHIDDTAVIRRGGRRRGGQIARHRYRQVVCTGSERFAATRMFRAFHHIERRRSRRRRGPAPVQRNGLSHDALQRGRAVPEGRPGQLGSPVSPPEGPSVFWLRQICLWTDDTTTYQDPFWKRRWPHLPAGTLLWIRSRWPSEARIGFVMTRRNRSAAEKHPNIPSVEFGR